MIAPLMLTMALISAPSTASVTPLTISAISKCLAMLSTSNSSENQPDKEEVRLAAIEDAYFKLIAGLPHSTLSELAKNPLLLPAATSGAQESNQMEALRQIFKIHIPTLSEPMRDRLLIEITSKLRRLLDASSEKQLDIDSHYSTQQKLEKASWDLDLSQPSRPIFSPDGQDVLTLKTRDQVDIYSADHDRFKRSITLTATDWNLPPNGGYDSFSFTQDASILMVKRNNWRTLELIEYSTGKLIGRFDYDRQIKSFDVSSDHSKLYISFYDVKQAQNDLDEILVVDIATQQTLEKIASAHEIRAVHVIPSTAGDMLFVRDDDTVKLFDPYPNYLFHHVSSEGDRYKTVGPTTYFAYRSANSSDHLNIRSVTKFGQKRIVHTSPPLFANQVRFSHDGKGIVILDELHNVSYVPFLISPGSLSFEEPRLLEVDDHAYALDVAANANIALVTSKNQLRIWDLDTFDGKTELLADQDDLFFNASISPDGHFVLVDSRKDGILFWNLRLNESFRLGWPAASELTWSRDGKAFIVKTDKRRKVYRVEGLDPLQPSDRHPQE